MPYNTVRYRSAKIEELLGVDIRGAVNDLGVRPLHVMANLGDPTTAQPQVSGDEVLVCRVAHKDSAAPQDEFSW